MITQNEDDYIDEDPVIPSQRWALISVLSPATVKTADNFKWDMRLLKIRYVCETEEQAIAKKDFLHKIDPFHHIFLMPIGRWCPFDDREEFAEEIDYGEERVNNMMKAFKDQHQKAEEYEAERRINAKKNATKHKKMMEKREKKEKEKLEKQINSVTTDHIVATELITENVNVLKLLNEKDLLNKIEELDIENKNILSKTNISSNKIEEIINENNLIDENIVMIENKVNNIESTISKIDNEYLKIQEKLKNLKSKNN